MSRETTSTIEEVEEAPKKVRAKAPAKKTTATRSAPKKPAAKKPAKKAVTKDLDTKAQSKPKTPRKRATRNVSTKTPKKKATSTSTTTDQADDVVMLQDTEIKQEADKVTATHSRKAPTTFADQAKQIKTKRIQYAVVTFLLVVGIGASAAVGVTDAGRIDVARTIQERNERMATMVDVDAPVTAVAAPAVNTGRAGEPDGGLIGLQPVVTTPATPMTAAELAAAAAVVASATTTAIDTATTTAETATQSESLSDVPLPEVDGVITHSATTTVIASSSDDTRSAE